MNLVFCKECRVILFSCAEHEEKVQRLVALGFPRQQCLEVLAACNGNEEHAASLLFEMTGGLGF